ncbi:YibE/F family protein [Lactovum odontotermitis]
MRISPLIKKVLFTLLASLLVFVLLDNDAFLYQKQPIGQISSVRQLSKDSVTDSKGNRDTVLTQELTIRLLNQSGKNFKLLNKTAVSQVTGQVYRTGQKVILNQVNGDYSILSLKRDALLGALITLFIGLLATFVRWRSSIFLILSLLLNLLYFGIALVFDLQFSGPVLLIFGILSFVFVISSLLFVLGRTRQMLFTFLTTMLTMLITFSLAISVLALTGNDGIHFEYLDFITQDPVDLFYMSCIISVLGAIMDGTGDIVVGLFGLYRQNQENQLEMTFKDYFRSGMSIGREIIGTLTNVLFMVFMAELLQNTILLLRNGLDWNYVAGVDLNMGLLQTIISGIGIVLSVPVTAFVTSLGVHAGSKAERSRERYSNGGAK